MFRPGPPPSFANDHPQDPPRHPWVQARIWRRKVCLVSNFVSLTAVAYRLAVSHPTIRSGSTPKCPPLDELRCLRGRRKVGCSRGQPTERGNCPRGTFSDASMVHVISLVRWLCWTFDYILSHGQFLYLILGNGDCGISASGS